MANRDGNTATSTEVIPAGHAELTAEEELAEDWSDTSTGLAGLSVAALGVVFGDIGTSPVYTFRECFNPEHGLPLDAEHVFGVLSMIFWALIIVVAAFNIISSMIMMVKDKGRDIAILRTMGASRAMILRIFVLSGASIGVIGTAAGFVLGLVFTDNIEAIRQAIQRIIGTDLFAAEIYFFTRIPARIDTGEVAAVVIMALALSFLATLYPSWRAARLDPVEALRYE